MARNAAKLLGHQQSFPLRFRLSVIRVVDLGRFMLPMLAAVNENGNCPLPSYTLRPDLRLLLISVAAGSSNRACCGVTDTERPASVAAVPSSFENENGIGERSGVVNGCIYTCWLEDDILVDPNIRNMDLIPFLGALSSPSMMSPMRMLTRAYSVSKKKTVQSDMNVKRLLHAKRCNAW